MITRTVKARTASWLLSAAIIGLAFVAPGAAVASDGPTIPMGTGADIKTMRGDKPTIVGLVDGYGGNTWRKQVLAELRDEASKCPNVTDVIYLGHAIPPRRTATSIALLRGGGGLIVFPDFGAAMIPATRDFTGADADIRLRNLKRGSEPTRNFSRANH